MTICTAGAGLERRLLWTSSPLKLLEKQDQEGVCMWGGASEGVTAQPQAAVGASCVANQGSMEATADGGVERTEKWSQEGNRGRESKG